MKIRLNTSYHCETTSEVDLPIDSWDEIESWFIKWDTLYYTINGGESGSIKLNSDVDDIIDWKRPASVEISDIENNVLDEE